MSTEPLLRFPDGLPDELLALDELELLHRLGRPTLVRWPGTGRSRPRAVATLLHGDESTGLEAMLRVLRRRRVYPFDLYHVIGNVKAALEPPGFACRYLDDQEDFNRVWGLGDPTTSQRRAADAILCELRAAGIESLVDVHNNTGDNPFYAIVTIETPEVINLATLFTTTLLRWDLELHTLMEATHDLCPSIAVECGLPGRPESVAFAVDALRRYLGAEPLATNQVLRDHDLLGGMHKVMVRPEVHFRFGGELDDDVDLVLDRDLDAHNFREVLPGLVLGWVQPGAAMPLHAIDADGNDVTDQHFEVVGQHVVVTTPGTPVMMTRTVAATRKDCLFYLATERPAPIDAGPVGTLDRPWDVAADGRFDDEPQGSLDPDAPFGDDPYGDAGSDGIDDGIDDDPNDPMHDTFGDPAHLRDLLDPRDGAGDDGIRDGFNGALPDGALPDGALLAGGALPDGALPNGALPDGALADGALPNGALPDGALLAGGAAHEEPPDPGSRPRHRGAAGPPD